MPISQQGALNTTALIVPDLYVQIVPPNVSLLNGVPTNIAGVVGTAQWGPVNSPTIIGSMADYARYFGAIQARKFDAGTLVAAAVLQGAQNFRVVRVTDGTDTAASIAIQAGAVPAVASVTFSTNPLPSSTLSIAGSVITFVASGATGLQVLIGANLAATLANLMTFLTGSADTNLVKATYALSGLTINLTAAATGASGNALTLATTVTGATVSGATFSGGSASSPALTVTSKYTGTLGNTTTVQIAAGSQANTSKIIVAISGQQPEVFDNIGSGLTGRALWAALASAINLGVSGLQGPSAIVTAAAGGVVAAPTNASFTLTGGSDGATGVTSTQLLGVDTAPRTGMYALRSQGVSVAGLADCDDSTSWATQVTFGLGEGIYMVGVGPANDTIANAITVKTTAGIDSYAFKLLFGDWVYFRDTVNNQTRLISPQGFIIGKLANLSPQNSTLNKQLYGIVGTQKSYAGLTYSSAELQALIQAGIDLITNPVPGGSYFGARAGHNSSSNAVIQGDNYTRMTNYIASTINQGMGIYIGQIQNPRTRRNAKATLDAFFLALYSQEMIGTADGSQAPWLVVLDATNNPQPRVALGYMQADVQVIYLSIIEKFIVNVEGGQSVSIVRQSTLPTT